MPRSPKLASVQAKEVQLAELELEDAAMPSAEVKKSKKRSKHEEAGAEGEVVEPTASKKAKKDKREKESSEAPACEDVGDEGLLSASEFRKKMDIQIKSEGDVPEPVQTFDAAPFSKRVRQALKDAGFAAPSAIQSQAWPIVAQGGDFIGVAKTGSGKTLAFMLPAFRMLSKTKPDCSEGPAVLVLAPTRELAVQIEEAAAKFGSHSDINCCVVYGGVPKPPQVKALRAHPQVVVATPGRLVDLMNDGSIKLGNASYLVLDEADRMLDMGFEPQMLQIMKQIPKERQTLMFSATWPKAIKKLAATYLTEAVHVNVGETDELAANKSVTQEFVKLNDDEKDSKLWRLMDAFTDKEKCIVFANTKRRIEKLSNDVLSSGYNCVVMSGDKTQQERDKGLADFVSGRSQIMFATDVCSRGLDIKGVTHVINYDMARDVDGYIHRIGRTGRAGMTGTSITFVNDDYDIPCSPALAKIAREAGQPVPDWLEKLVSKAATGKKDKLWQY